MNKKQLINEIIDLCDENENLKNKLNSYEVKIDPVKTSITEKTEKEIEIEKLNNKAKKLLFNDCMNSWYFPNVEVKEDSGEFNFLFFEQWLKAIDLSNLLTSSYKYLFDFFTNTEIKEYFKDELKDKYEKMLNAKKMEIVRSKKDDS